MKLHNDAMVQDMHKGIVQIAIAVVSALRALDLSITAGLEQLGPANRAGVQCSSPGDCSHSVSCRKDSQRPL